MPKMKTLAKIAIAAGGAALAAAGAAVFLTAPGRSAKNVKQQFAGVNFAHRGLHSPDKSVPENSLSAFRLAAEAGYGVELDVHLTKDGKVVVFHDDTLQRICGAEGNLRDFTLDELRQLRLCDTQETIPTLEEVFEALGGVPVVLEVKRGKGRDELCQKVLSAIDHYRGPVCVESFDPFIVRWFRKNAPDIFRGQLSCSSKKLSLAADKFSAFMLGNLLTNFIARPHFVAWGMDKKPLGLLLCEALGGMKVAWTARKLSDWKDNEAVIFEFCRPEPRF